MLEKNVNIVLVAIAATTVFSASGVESSMSGTDILAGRSPGGLDSRPNHIPRDAELFLSET